MDVKNAIRGRRSVRKFRNDKIALDILEEILEEARWAPSWGNTQPWEIYVVTGKPLEEYRDESVRAAKSGAASSPDIPMPQAWPDQMKKRYGEMGEVILKSLDIKREDKEARKRQNEFIAALFGAPCLMVLCVPSDHSAIGYAMLDIGIITQSICLSAYDRGIGSCIMAFSVTHPEILRKVAPIPDKSKIVVGIALGYREEGYPLNEFERNRVGLNEFVRWIG